MNQIGQSAKTWAGHGSQARQTLTSKAKTVEDFAALFSHTVCNRKKSNPVQKNWRGENALKVQDQDRRV